MANPSSLLISSLIGLSAAAAGGAYFFYGSPWEANKPLFKDKFKHALLSTDSNTDDALWANKWTTLKGLSKVKNTKLAEAFRDHKDKAIDEVIRNLMKQGCKEIYDSEFVGEESESYSDFKQVCSRNVKDKVGGTWLTSSGNNVDGKWNSLSSASIDTLTEALKGIKGKEVSAGKAELQKWCDSISALPYDGDGTTLTNNATSYCKVS
ncbi:hypothetical protein HF1_07450 [Mycoplasma haemofelis str. Langford 1]|uniref:Uncharacterized protein n=1 Tax=Mycoplasma haemofelis (strain Langford 1) TaxID=941640 RepID=E8ZHY2_MYCHL|nr:hypothetical protein [Mycoplasma haemofelis]CBY92753.1 hypothetical protein HF1_07450 [Mycoplasma haemofelis str. Langford 1]